MSDALEALNIRAQRLGYEVIADETLPVNAAGTPFRVNLGHGPWCRILRDGEPAFKFAWSAGETEQWLVFREREAKEARMAA